MSLVFLRGQMAAASAAGFEVWVICSPGHDARARVEAEGARWVPIAMARAIAPLADIAALARITRALIAVRPDIVNAGTPKAGLLVLLAARLTGVKGRLHTLHGLRAETLRGPQRWLVAAMTAMTCRLAQRVICVSPSLAARAVELRMVAADRTIVFGAGSANGLDMDRYHLTDTARNEGAKIRQQCGIDSNAPIIGFVGRLSRDKGIPELSIAWRALRRDYPDLHWLIVGPKESIDAVPDETTRMLDSDPRIHRLGWLDDPVSAYCAMDVVVAPTHREGFGYVLIEAAALERPVVATRVTGCVDAVADGVTGTLVPVGDSTALTAAIGAYLDDSVLRARHGQAGRKRVERLFERTALWRRLHHEYRALLTETQ